MTQNFTKGEHPGFYRAEAGEETVADEDGTYWNLPRQARAARTTIYKAKYEKEAKLRAEEGKAAEDRIVQLARAMAMGMQQQQPVMMPQPHMQNNRFDGPDPDEQLRENRQRQQGYQKKAKARIV
jgi:hypothetical protein